MLNINTSSMTGGRVRMEEEPQTRARHLERAFLSLLVLCLMLAQRQNADRWKQFDDEDDEFTFLI